MRIRHFFSNARMRALGLAALNAGFLLVVFSVPALAQGAKNGLPQAIAELAKLLIDGIIGLSAVLLAIGLATGFLAGQVEVMVGRPGGLSSTWMRIAGIIVCFVGAIFTITISNAIIDALKTYKDTSGITLP